MRRDVFQAIAGPIRRDIIALFAAETRAINSIAEKFEISRPTISKQLKIITVCEIIDFEKGGERFCFIRLKKPSSGFYVDRTIPDL